MIVLVVNVGRVGIQTGDYHFNGSGDCVDYPTRPILNTVNWIKLELEWIIEHHYLNICPRIICHKFINNNI